jgi:response regulator RpfG family c-di-GMP phosphodiesterase
MNAVSTSVRFEARQSGPPPWTVLIVDDEPEVHAVTKLALGNFRFADRPLRFLNAHNTSQAEALLNEHSDIAVMLLDVVMETDRAGLDLVRTVRERLGNQFVRIVLRTGQPGQAPEQQIISTYDINDYKEKTELTAQKLATTMFAALRSYRDMRAIEANRRGLERVINASAYIFSHEHSQQFASAVLEQLSELVGLERGALYCKIAHPNAELPEHFHVAAATGDYRSFVDRNADEKLPRHIVTSLRNAFLGKRHVFGDDHYVLYVADARASESLLYVGENWNLSELDHRLVEVFCTNVSIAYENLHLHRELFDSQMEMIYLLAGAAETRSYETANHVKRVGLIAELLGQLYGMDEKTTADLRLAAPLHDIGKIGIPDAVLNKPGAHTPDETVIMRTHAELGAKLLANSKRPLLKLAAEIALSHHENWDGSGYPKGLRGEAIPIGGRITMLADVFDALGSRRCYKEPWSIDDIRAFIVEQNGKKFEPRLVELAFEHWDRIQAVRGQLPD